MMLRALVLATGLLLIPQAVLAQSCPTTAASPAFTAGGSVFGRIAAQWNGYFAAKADANNGVLCNPTIVGGSVPGSSFRVGPGLSNQLGTRNDGEQTIVNNGTLFDQLWPTAKPAS